MTQLLTQHAAAYRVTLDNGMTLVGWAIRADTVVVQASGITGPVSVTIDDQQVEVTEIFASNGVEGLSMPLSALELPQGSLPLAGEVLPAHLAPTQVDDGTSTTSSARTFVWCLIFPRMRGCH